jgi:hypothetical protein
MSDRSKGGRGYLNEAAEGVGTPVLKAPTIYQNFRRDRIVEGGTAAA